VIPTELIDAPRVAAAAVAARLVGARIPEIELGSASEGEIEMDFITRNAAILYFYPGTLSQPLAAQDSAEARDFRDHYAHLLTRGYHVIGVHAQTPAYQLHHMMAGVEHFLVADPNLLLADLLDIPTYDVDGKRVYRRLTLVVEESRIVHVFYPVASPDRSATQVIAWLRRCRPRGRTGLLQP
jgi:peroxiredoxin